MLKEAEQKSFTEITYHAIDKTIDEWNVYCHNLTFCHLNASLNFISHEN